MSNRELDKEIATKIFKLAVVAQGDEFFLTRRGNFSLKPVPKYSSDIDLAHQVLMAMRNRGFSYNVGSRIENNSLVWVASFHPNNSTPIFSKGKSLSEAICLAAIEAKRKRPKISNQILVDSKERVILIEDFKKKE